MAACNIENVPTEILVEIFLECLPALQENPRPSLRHAPLQLTAVCQQWRIIAENTSQLWISLAFDLNTPPALIQYWNECAKERPRTVSYYHPNNARRMDCLTLATLAPFFGRIQHLTIPAMPLTFLVIYHQKLDWSFMRTLSLSSNHHIDAIVPSISKIDLAGALNLRELTLYSKSAFSFVSRLTNIPWHQLTILKITEIFLHPNDARAALVQCTNVVECVLSVHHYPPFENDALDLPVVSLNHLIELHLHVFSTFDREDIFSSMGRISPFFQPFILPALRDLSISTDYFVRDMAIAGALIALKERSSPFPLRQFTLCRVSCDLEPLRVFIISLSTLQKFSIEAPPGDDSTAWELIPGILEHDLHHLTSLTIVDELPFSIVVMVYAEGGVWQLMSHEYKIMYVIGNHIFCGVGSTRRVLVSLLWGNAPKVWLPDGENMQMTGMEERRASLREDGVEFETTMFERNWNVPILHLPWLNNSSN